MFVFVEAGVVGTVVNRYEFSGCPILSNPLSNRTSPTTGTVAVTSNMPGELFFLVLDESAATPDADTIINTGQLHTASSGSNALSITGIPTYDALSVFMVLRDEDGNISNVVRAVIPEYVPDGGTPPPPPPQRPTLSLPIQTIPRKLWLQTGANSNQGMHVTLPTINTRILGGAHGDLRHIINVAIPNGQQISHQLTYIDNALDVVNKKRARLGAYQNRLEFTMRSLAISSENLSDSESRIRNADIAREKMSFVKANILQQTGIAMLAQANQNTQMLLSLLR